MGFKLYTLIGIFSIVFNAGIKEIYCYPNYIDLTHPFHNDQPHWSSMKPFNLSIITRGLTTQGSQSNVYVEINEFSLVSNACLQIINSVQHIF